MISWERTARIVDGRIAFYTSGSERQGNVNWCKHSMTPGHKIGVLTSGLPIRGPGKISLARHNGPLGLQGALAHLLECQSAYGGQTIE
jgi:hypothetical protein